MDGLAKEVHDLIAKLPDSSAQIVAAMIVNEGFHYDLQGVDVSKAYFESKAQDIEQVKRQILRSYVSKRQNGEDIEPILRLVDAIAKADVRPGFQGQHHQFEEKEHPRGFHGRFSPKPGKAFHDKKGRRVSAVDTASAIAEAASHAGRATRSNRYGSQGDNEAFVPGVQNYRRLQAGANFLQATAGGYLPPSAQLGLHAAGFVGQYGPVAQQALGPAIDRAKYRYTGIERKLDPDLVKALRADKAGAANGKQDFDDYVVRGGALPKGRRPGQWVGEENWQPSQTLAYFLSKRPNRGLAALQRASGHQPASEGIILDAQGRPSTQMIGRGDDWYLPFDLRNLGTLKGGQYIRTRTDGGLTTEDVYTGLMAGARQMTVVSHNGVYTMAFDDTLRGSRRYSQAAREMTERYGQLLDAVKSGQVRVNNIGSIDPDRVRELQDEADGDSEVFQALLERNYAKPVPSREMQQSWQHDFLTEQAEGFDTGRPEESAWEAFRDQKVVPAMVAEQLRASIIPGGPPDPFLDEDALRRQAELALEADPSQGIHALGLTDDYRKYASDQLQGYREAMAPVELDGPGYDYAMQALKEQFPYFIKSTSYVPLSKARRDRGYVMPRYNRSADVKAGYFDPQITGFGKVPANRTRFQNSRVTRTVEQGWRPGGEDRNVVARQQTAAEGNTTAGSSGAPKSQPVNMSDRRAADLALARALTSAKKIGPNWTYTGTTPDFYQQHRNAELHEGHKNWMGSPDHPDYNNFARPYEDFEKMSDDELHSKVEQMNKVNQRDKFIEVPADVQGKFGAQGGPLPKRKPAEIHALILDKPDNFDPEFDEDLDFPEAPEGRDKAYYQSAYYSNPSIQRLVKRGELPVVFSDDNLPEMATEYVDNELDRLMEAQEKGLNGANHAQNVLHALLAKQLHRYYKRATGGGGGGIIPPRQIIPPNGGGAPAPIMGSAAFAQNFPAGGSLVRLSDAVIPRYNPN